MEDGTELYRRRFLMLFLFVLYSTSNAFQWIEYAIITSVVSKYYGVDGLAINWTSVIYMVSYIPLIFPANWILERWGLRVAVLLGSAGTCIGSWVKCGSLSPDRFLVTMLGQAIVAISQIFVLGIPAQLAGVWFSSTEVSRATGVGVFGNQLGVALGFVLPPLIVKNSDDPDVVTHGLSILFYGVAGITTVLFVAILFLFKEKPPKPPSKAQAAVRANDDKAGYWVSILNLVKNLNYMLLLVAYGINVGVFYAISTLLNQMVVSYYPGAEESAGLMGLAIVLSGMCGSVVCGIILDKTHKFKETCLAVYVMSVCGMVGYSAVLRFGTIALLYLAAIALGFFMTGYLPLGFEFAAELTYPEPEATSSGLLNASAQFFGIIFTIGAGALLNRYGDLAANISLIATLFVGTAITAVIKSDLRRQKASMSSTDDPKAALRDKISPC